MMLCSPTSQETPAFRKFAFSTPSLFDLVPSQNTELHGIVDSCRKGIVAGVKPKLVEEGLGGTYFLQDGTDNGTVVAVFKPCDEDPCSPNNPKSQDNELGFRPPLRKGIQSGVAVFRECVAWWLDQCSNGFVGIPPTTIVALVEKDNQNPNRASCSPRMTATSSERKQKGIDFSDAAQTSFSHRRSQSISPTVRIGSLQKWMNHHHQSWDIGISLFPVQQVHRIGLFDIRVLNTDRHGGNILVQESKDAWGPKFDLIPIDHSFILPSTLSEAYFEWLHWPQAKLPFNEASKQYVASLDWKSDVELIKTNLRPIQTICGSTNNQHKQPFTEKHFRVLRITTTFLKKTVLAGCCLFDIASMICRDITSDKPSMLEVLCSKALRKTLHSETLAPDEFYLIEDWSPNNVDDEEIFFKELEFLIDDYLLYFFPVSPRK